MGKIKFCDYIPFISGVISIIASSLICIYCDKVEWSTGLIITLCVGLAITILAQSVLDAIRERGLLQKIDRIDETIEHLQKEMVCLINSVDQMSHNVIDIQRGLDSIVNEINEIKVVKNFKSIAEHGSHPYFQKMAKRIWDNIMGQYSDFFKGTYQTCPKSDYTFGVPGIRYTKKKLVATSVVSDYWEGGFVGEYLKAHEELIKRNVQIQRIFILSEDKFDLLKDVMKRQSDIGVDVRFIYSNNKYVTPGWLKEDYLIQDDKLLVQISCSTHTSDEENTELITIDVTKVNMMIGHYNKLLEYTTKYE